MPPGVRLGASLDLMGTPVRASAVVYIERVRANATELCLEIRLAEVSLKVTDDTSTTPIAALLKSGALDLSKPGNLVMYMPKRPPILVDAKDDRIVIDLMRHPKFAKNETAQRLVRVLAPLGHRVWHRVRVAAPRRRAASVPRRRRRGDRARAQSALAPDPRMFSVEPVANYHCQVGENPLWDEREGRLYWVDIDSARLFRVDHESWRARVLSS